MLLPYILIFFMGLILPFAFAPLSVFTLAFIAPAVLLYQWQKSTPRQAFILGLLFGLGFFGVGVSWVYISIHTFGNASAFISTLITFAMVTFLALFPAVQGYLLMRFFAKKNQVALCLAAFPVTWVFFEWARSLPLNGFPWLYLGYSQMTTPLRGFAPFAGVYGVSLAVAIICGCFVLMSTRQSLRTKLLALGILAILIFAGWQLSHIKWTKRSGPPLTVTLVQANISQSIKWQPGRFDTILKTYQDLTAAQWANNRLIVWPEAALPAFAVEVAGVLDHLDATARENKTTLMLGILLADGPQRDYNGILLLGTDHGEYRKRHLVPFGEYTPLPKVFSFLLHYWNIPMSSFQAGPEQQVSFSVAGIPIAAFICYEIAYPSHVLKYTQNRQLIINISDDSWFGKSMASSQQMQMARMRALETGRFALLAANTGVTAIIDPQGQLVSALPLHQSGILTSTVSAMVGKTPLMHLYYYPLIAVMVLMLLTFLL